MFLLSKIVFHSIIGLAFGRMGLYGPDQPFDPNNPINPVASGVFSVLTAVLSGYLTLQVFGQEQQVLGAIGAAAGSVVLTRVARSFGILGKKALH